MVEYVKTTASPSRIEIDTRTIAINSIEGRNLHPLWLAASAAIIVHSDQGPCVLLVQRKGITLHSGKWALIPAGGSECIAELQRPSLVLKRELKEELKLTHKGEKICNPLEYMERLPLNQVVICDKASGEVLEQGEIIPAQGQFIFMQAYFLKLPLEELIIRDGEKGEFDNELDRVIAAVRVYDDLHSHVIPVKKFHSGVCSMNPLPIDLSGYQTPTLDWFRQYRHRIKNQVKNISEKNK